MSTYRYVGILFLTTPSKVPSEPKTVVTWLSIGPGSWNETENSPGGQRFCDCIWNTILCFLTVFSPVDVTPLIVTFPSGWHSYLKACHQQRQISVKLAKGSRSRIDPLFRNKFTIWHVFYSIRIRPVSYLSIVL